MPTSTSPSVPHVEHRCDGFRLHGPFSALRAAHQLADLHEPLLRMKPVVEPMRSDPPGAVATQAAGGDGVRRLKVRQPHLVLRARDHPLGTYENGRNRERGTWRSVRAKSLGRPEKVAQERRLAGAYLAGDHLIGACVSRLVIRQSRDK